MLISSPFKSKRQLMVIVSPSFILDKSKAQGVIAVFSGSSASIPSVTVPSIVSLLHEVIKIVSKNINRVLIFFLIML